MLASAAGQILLLKNERSRRLGLFLLVQFLVSFVTFTRTQDILACHAYLPAGTFLILTGVCLTKVRDVVASTHARTVMLGVIGLAIMLANFTIVLQPGADRVLRSVAWALPRSRHAPMTRNDLPELRRFVSTLNGLTANSEQTVYVLSSSEILNASIVSNACQMLGPDGTKLQRHILSTSDVDRRDGFPRGLVNADLVVVTEPIGYHLAPDDQRVIGVPAGEILGSRGIGAAYRRLPESFALDSRTTALIYRRQRLWTEEDRRRLTTIFVQWYPSHRSEFDLETSDQKPPGTGG